MDEQSQVEAGGGRRWMNSSQWRQSTVEMNSISWSPVFQYATPLPMNRTPVSTVVLQHKSVSSVLRYARPLPINRIPFQTWPVEHKAVSPVLRYARPRFHRVFHPSRLAPDEQHMFHCLLMNTTHSVASP